VLTTSDDIFEVNKAYKLGASSFLTKPFNFTEFRDIVQAVHNYWLKVNRAPAVERPTGPGIRLPEENYRSMSQS